MIGKSIDQQSMPINRLISIIDEQSMLEFYVIIDFIDYQFLSIINTNASVNLHRLSSIGCHFFCVLFSVKISKTRSLYASNNDENCNKTLIFFTTVIDTSWRTWARDFIEPSPNGKELGSFRFEYEYEIEYEYDFSILVFRLHIITTHAHFSR